MNTPKYVIFDLYGTLLSFNQLAFIKDLSNVLRARPREVARKFFLDYATTSFHSHEEMVIDLINSVENCADAHANERCVALISRHLSNVTLIDQAHHVLSFLKASGFKIGLISNVAQPFKLPFYNSALPPYFDCTVFSCDAGVTKPNAAIYEILLTQLGAQAKECVFVGDSWRNDYLTPKAMGMQAVWIGSSKYTDVERIERLSDLAWYSFDDHKTILKSGDAITFKEATYVISDLEALPDKMRGKYNIVTKATLINETEKSAHRIYLKRFSQAGSAKVEKLAYDIYSLVQASNCSADVLEVGEMVLATSEIAGEPWSEKYAHLLSDQIGFQLAMAYVFAYADVRPRNIILQQTVYSTVLNVIDMEHCFFSKALDLTDLDNVLLPSTFDALPAAECLRRVKKNVLGIKTLRRVIKGFIPKFDDSKFYEFQQGWLAGYDKINMNLPAIEQALREAIQQPPYPVIGTHAYRRALANIDINDIVKRAQEDPENTLDEIV